MAFFKIRRPEQQAAEAKPAKVSRAVRGETVEVMRRRARHRLMGAALLVLLGVVGFPLIFDTQPRPIPVDTPIEIPDRDKVAPLVVPAQVPVTPPAARDVPAVAQERELEAAVEAIPPVPGSTAVAPPTHKDGSAPAFTEARPQPDKGKSETRAEIPATPSPAVASPTPQGAPVSEAERARALLEGRPGKAPATSGQPAAAAAGVAGDERFIVQVGAFSDEAKVREARQKLERAGLTTYTQAVNTKDGKRTRVRVGPFQGRAQAEKASEKIRSLGLPVAILTL